MEKVHTSPLNYHPIINVPLNYQLCQCSPMNYQTMSMFPNDKNIIHKIIKILKII